MRQSATAVMIDLPMRRFPVVLLAACAAPPPPAAPIDNQTADHAMVPFEITMRRCTDCGQRYKLDGGGRALESDPRAGGVARVHRNELGDRAAAHSRRLRFGEVILRRTGLVVRSVQFE